MYLPNAESLSTYSCSTKGAKLQKMASRFMLPAVSADDALEEARDLSKELEQLDLAAEHCSRCDESALETLAEWSEEDLGLIELSKKLGIHE